ncbi:MAG: glycosyltransferase [Vicinamibacteria bacterium]|nr:glycosyltransferase [Vicinamibacteria bacterium]
MIPTFNCASVLREALEGVLAQDPGRAAMQIAVVDDCSTDEPEAVCRQVAGDRVDFHRQPRNVGVSRNFNTCLRRSRGELVHILHGDDVVEPGFYERMSGAASRWPGAAIFMARARHVAADGAPLATSPFVAAYRERSCDPRPLWPANPLRTPAIVVRRRFYERHGGFCEALDHVADWEMWVRAVASEGGVMLDAVLSRYRESASNHSSRVQRSGDGLRDWLRVGQLFASRYADFDLEAHHRIVRLAASEHLDGFRRRGDLEAVARLERLLPEIPPPGRESGWTAWAARWLRATGVAEPRR